MSLLQNWETEDITICCVDKTIFSYEPHMENHQHADPEKECPPNKRQKAVTLWKQFLADEIGFTPVISINRYISSFPF